MSEKKVSLLGAPGGTEVPERRATNTVDLTEKKENIMTPEGRMLTDAPPVARAEARQAKQKKRDVVALARGLAEDAQVVLGTFEQIDEMRVELVNRIAGMERQLAELKRLWGGAP